MNNGIKIFLIVLLSLLVLGLVFFLVGFIVNGYSFDFIFGETKLIETKEFDSINNLSIDTNIADIYIKESKDDKVKVELYSKKYEEKEISNTEKELKVTLKEKCVLFCFFNRSKINVYLPKNYDKDIVINSTTGDIEVDSYSKSDAVINTTTGDINLKSIKDATVNVTTGDIDIDEVNDLVINSTTGDINLGIVNNSIELSTTTGDIDIKELNINKNSKIKASTGDICIKKTNSIYIEGNTSTGDVNISNNNRKSDIELKIKTSTGDIDVN